jgi:N-acetylglucosaminyldiphosphoundecaprenol N-acetyl-beta-D-mannosaminyltransferase
MATVLDIKLFDKGLEKAVKRIIESCQNGKLNFCVSATGAHGIITARKDLKFREILNSFYINLPDGMPGVWIGRLKGTAEMRRCYGPDFFKELIISTRDKKINHFLCGGEEGISEELKKICEEGFGNKNIVGVYSPPFREMTDEELKNLAGDINKLNTDIVWIGLSTPKQEFFAHRLAKFTNVHFICTVGAAFDFHTGKVKQAPKWVQNIGLEWLFRLIIEPKRLWKRYFEIVPLFVFYNLIEFLKSDFLKKKWMVNR